MEKIVLLLVLGLGFSSFVFADEKQEVYEYIDKVESIRGTTIEDIKEMDKKMRSLPSTSSMQERKKLLSAIIADEARQRKTQLLSLSVPSSCSLMHSLALKDCQLQIDEHNALKSGNVEQAELLRKQYIEARHELSDEKSRLRREYAGSPETVAKPQKESRIYYLSIDSISFKPDSPKVGDTVTIDVSIANKVGAALSEVKVLVNDGGGWSDSEVVSFKPKETKLVQLSLLAKDMHVYRNPHKFKITVISDNKLMQQEIQQPITVAPK